MNWKLWLLIIILVFSFLAIFGLPPQFMEKGVVIKNIESNSSSFEKGLRKGQIITSIDNQEIENMDDYTNIIKNKFNNNESKKIIIKTKDIEAILYTDTAPNILVSDIPKTNLKMGLDLAGGSRALIKAENKTLSESEVNDLVEITENRLNEFGLTDLKVSSAGDLEGNKYVRVEIAGTTPDDLKELIGKQGKFEARIKNQTVFIGGDKDIASVCRGDPSCSGIRSCDQDSDGDYYCKFMFSIYLSENAAKKHSEVTSELEINSTAQGNYLSEKLDLYLDDNLVDSLLIGEELKGKETTEISISGSGQGKTEDAAYEDAKKSMNKLQTILITGSLPYKLEIVKLDTISPFLGDNFIKSILLAAITALLVASIIVFIRYRSIKSSLTLVFISFSEIIIILGIASLIRWNLDLPSIAGILATIGTGFDDQIIILDETRREKEVSLKQRIKRAFTIIFGAYFTALVSLFPLLWAGAGLLKGFAITTIIGISVGVLITRPAFSEIIKKIEK